jgi:hypothetical protein
MRLVLHSMQLVLLMDLSASQLVSTVDVSGCTLTDRVVQMQLV